MGALARAAEYRLVAAGFAYPDGRGLPMGETCEAARAMGPAGAADLIVQLDAEAHRLGSNRKYEYECLFGFTGGGELSLYETEHVGQEIFRKSRDLADISGFYRAFGMEVNAADRERVDHLSVEAEFLAWLCIKQAVALSEGLPDQATVCREAEVRFLGDHFLRWVPTVSKRIAGSTGGFYRTLALLTAAFAERVSSEKEAE